MEVVDAVILAAGRLPEREARRAGVTLKALAPVGNSTPLAAAIAAMRSARSVQRVIVVAPSGLHGSSSDVDAWVDERESGEDNVLAGLRAALTRRAILSASDAPFVDASHVNDFLMRVPDDADFAYPVFTSAEFLAAFPGGRSRFARVGNVRWTGGSLCVLNVAMALRNAQLIRRGFTARKSQVAMASLLGIGCVVRYAMGRLELEEIERRLGHLTGGKAVAVRGAHAALAMDCDSALDIEYVCARHAQGLQR